MYNFPAIYIANGTAILLLLVVMLSIRKPLHHGLFEEKMYYAMIVINIMQCILEVVTFLLNGKIEYRTLTVVLNVLLFSNSLIFSFFWTIYADYKLFADMRRIRRIYPFIAIPAVLMIIGCFINLVTPVFFVIDEYNVYQRTDLFFLTYVVTYSYLVYGVVLISMYRKKVHKYLFLPAVLFMIPVVIGSALQFAFYGYSLVWLGVSIGMIWLFINVQNEASYVDMLSGLFNRQYLNDILLMHSRKGDKGSILAGIMLDIDSFKEINNKFGHLVGDEAISAVGKILHTAVGSKGISCRYGGDEFIILMKTDSPKEIMDMIDTVRTKAALFNEAEKTPYQIHFSIGHSTYQSGHESTDAFLKRIDTAMYEDKRRKIDEGIIPDRRWSY
ncbi:MAG: GGDEF domain-containing protein [Christensenellales bacterium]|jgi:diguanylate cyclase (GGDEF)-like protein